MAEPEDNPQPSGSGPQRRARHADPEAFLLEVLDRAEHRMGSGSAEALGAAAGAALALFVPMGPGLLLRGAIGSALGSLLGKRVAGQDAVWFRRRLELALDRFEEINRFHTEGRCSQRARDEYVDDLIERVFDRGDSLLE